MSMLPPFPCSFTVINLGCKVNRVEADTISAGLLAQGCTSDSEELADLIVINTCTVTGDAEKKARKAVRHALSCNPAAEVIVTGCATAINPQEFSQIDERVTVVGRIELPEVLGISKGNDSRLLRFGDEFRTRVNLKVQDGCDNACSYCIVHVARGKSRSVPFDEVLAQAKPYFEHGAKELVLTGINLGSYRDGNRTLSDICKALLELSDGFAPGNEPAARLRISSIEPKDIGDGLIQVMSESDGRICRHLHIPLQSGSSRVLKEMCRPYDRRFYEDLALRLKEAMPSIALATDIIVGFPGETEEDFMDTMSLAETCGFMNIHIFHYSMRSGTPAAERSDQIAPEKKTLRAAQLRHLSAILKRADYERRMGTTEYALVEKGSAITESYHRVNVSGNAQQGSLIPYTFA